MADLIWRKPVNPSERGARFPGFWKGDRILPRDTQNPGHLPLRNDIELRESVSMHLSDGVQLYSDIFLPANRDTERVPALIAWSPYGKQGGTTLLDDFPGRAGVPREWTSGFEKWEGPDPAYWCYHNYAIVNVDSRGAYTSEGDLVILGQEEANDAAQFATWVSEQAWCNGNVAFTGNSWLAIVQWKVASLQPKGLVAIAPWEGFADLYHDLICDGNIPNTGFFESIVNKLSGNGRLEDIPAMLRQNPSYDEYWQSKRACVEDIKIPVYCVASWTNPVHTPGTLNAWNRLRSPRWLRVHALQEWPDYYTDANVKDLHRFFDFYLKGVKNDWESTPRVRLSILQFGLGTIDHIINRSEYDFPIPRTQYKRYYLSESVLALIPPNQSSKSYSSEDGCLTFSWNHSACETTGCFSINLRMSADHGGMDVYAFIEVYRMNSRQGVLCINPQRAAIKLLFKLMHDWQIGVNKGFIFYWGPNGCLRSRQAESQSGEQRILKFDMKQSGISWQQDDEMRLTICGRQPKHLILPGVKETENINKGFHTIHFGEDSYLIVPHV